jgi:hypothetical protein
MSPPKSRSTHSSEGELLDKFEFSILGFITDVAGLIRLGNHVGGGHSIEGGVIRDF